MRLAVLTQVVRRQAVGTAVWRPKVPPADPEREPVSEQERQGAAVPSGSRARARNLITARRLSLAVQVRPGPAPATTTTSFRRGRCTTRRRRRRLLRQALVRREGGSEG